MVEEVFDLPRRGLTLAVGQVLDGVISAGMTLRAEGSDSLIKIAGIDLIPLPPDNPNRASLIIAPDSAARPAQGMIRVTR